MTLHIFETKYGLSFKLGTCQKLKYSYKLIVRALLNFMAVWQFNLEYQKYLGILKTKQEVYKVLKSCKIDLYIYSKRRSCFEASCDGWKRRHSWRSIIHQPALMPHSQEQLGHDTPSRQNSDWTVFDEHRASDMSPLLVLDCKDIKTF